MRRYWIPKENISSDFVEIKGDEFHHIFEVCRQGIGSQFEVLGRTGEALLVEVQKMDRKCATAKILQSRLIQIKGPRLHLAICVPKFAVFESVLEKAVELGVSSVQPLFSDYSFVRTPDKISTERTQRWQKILLSATQQSGRGEPMGLATPIHLEDWLKQWKDHREAPVLFAFEGDAKLNIKTFIQEKITTSPSDFWILVGGEGGFSKSEVKSIQELGIQPVTLGEQVLRVETACIALLSVLKYELSSLSS